MQILEHVCKLVCMLSLVLSHSGCEKTKTAPDEAQIDKDTTAQKSKKAIIDYGQFPTEESFLATFLKWNEATKIEDVEERIKALDLMYAIRDDVKALFGERADRIQDFVELTAEYEKRTRKFPGFERSTLKPILFTKDSGRGDIDAEYVLSLVPAGTPIFSLRVGNGGIGPCFFVNNRWVFVPDPGDVY